LGGGWSKGRGRRAAGGEAGEGEGRPAAPRLGSAAGARLGSSAGAGEKKPAREGRPRPRTGEEKCRREVRRQRHLHLAGWSEGGRRERNGVVGRPRWVGGWVC
jgi:hypothetical protein